MPKRMLALIIVLSFFSPISYAMPYYLAPSLYYQSVSYDHVHYEGIGPHFAAGINNYNFPANGWLYYAGELFIAPFSIKTHKTKNALFNLTTKVSYGASFIPGIWLEPSLLAYLRLGFMTTKFVDFSCKTGYQGGVGMQFEWDQFWKIRGEFMYTAYKKIDGERLKSYDYLLGLVYQLC